MNYWEEGSSIFGDHPNKNEEEVHKNLIIDSLNIIPNEKILKLNIGKEEIIIGQIKYNDNSTSDNVKFYISEIDKIDYHKDPNKKNQLIIRAKKIGELTITVYSEEDYSKNKIIKIVIDNEKNDSNNFSYKDIKPFSNIRDKFINKVYNEYAKFKEINIISIYINFEDSIIEGYIKINESYKVIKEPINLLNFPKIIGKIDIT